MKLTFTEDTNLEQKRRECLDYLNRTKVDVGLTSSASGRSRFLMALHEHGAPGAHIPARPVIAPALGAAEAREAVSRIIDIEYLGDVTGQTGRIEFGNIDLKSFFAYYLDYPVDHVQISLRRLDPQFLIEKAGACGGQGFQQAPL